MTLVLDASAMIAYLRDEPGAGDVAAALLDPDNRCVAHAVNLCEVFYEFHRASGQDVARSAITDLSRVGVIQSTEMSEEFWQSAGVLKAVHRRVSLADCFAIALARKVSGVVVTADHHEFDSLAEQAVCEVRFIR